MSFAGLVVLAGAASATSFYASPSGSAGGDGTIGKPWTLTKALSQPAGVRPGDTIWLRGGTYAGGTGSAYSFSCYLNGAPAAPITVAQYPGERAKLDGRGAVYGALLVQYTSWVVFLDFEITDSDFSPSASPSGLWVRDSNNTKFVNLVIHDMPGCGVGFWIENTDSEIYGCLIYYNGRNKLEHGVYLDNRSGSKTIADSIVFNNYGYGIHGYASTANDYENNITLDGNIAFNNGQLAPGAIQGANLLVGVDSGGGSPALSPVITNNFTYRPNQGPGGQSFGYVKGCTNPTVTYNYFVGVTRWAACTTNAAIAGNTFYGSQFATAGPLPSPSTFSSNTYITTRPSTARVAVRPNGYKAGRGNIVVYNWGLQSSVSVDLSGVLSPGASYEIRNAQNFFGSPVSTGIYYGTPVSIPMAGSVAASVAFGAPAPTGPEFNAFVVLKR
jgi:hypothetical protein